MSDAVKAPRKLNSGSVIFVDDIRTEDSGKEILVGLYDDCLEVDGFPHVIPQMSAKVLLKFEAFQGSGAIKVNFNVPGMPEPIVRDIYVPDFDPENVSTGEVLEVRSSFQIGPVAIQEPGSIVVTASMDDNEIKVGSLIVQQSEQKESIPLYVPVVHYAFIKDELDHEGRAELAEEVLEFLYSQAPQIKKPSVLGNIILKIGYNEFMIFKGLEAMAVSRGEINFESVPKYEAMEIIKETKYTAHVRFKSAEELRRLRIKKVGEG